MAYDITIKLDIRAADAVKAKLTQYGEIEVPISANMLEQLAAEELKLLSEYLDNPYSNPSRLKATQLGIEGVREGLAWFRDWKIKQEMDRAKRAEEKKERFFAEKSALIDAYSNNDLEKIIYTENTYKAHQLLNIAKIRYGVFPDDWKKDPELSDLRKKVDAEVEKLNAGFESKWRAAVAARDAQEKAAQEKEDCFYEQAIKFICETGTESQKERAGRGMISKKEIVKFVTDDTFKNLDAKFEQFTEIDHDEIEHGEDCQSNYNGNQDVEEDNQPVKYLNDLYFDRLKTIEAQMPEGAAATVILEYIYCSDCGDKCEGKEVHQYTAVVGVERFGKLLSRTYTLGDSFAATQADREGE